MAIFTTNESGNSGLSEAAVESLALVAKRANQNENDRVRISENINELTIVLNRLVEKKIIEVRIEKNKAEIEKENNRIVNCFKSTGAKYQRKKIVPQAKGTVLEIGVGSGLNIPFYEKKGIHKVYGLDPSEELCEMARKTAKNAALKFITWSKEFEPYKVNDYKRAYCLLKDER